MSAPFRDLFVELPRAMFEALQCIGEEAAQRALARDAPTLTGRPPLYVRVISEMSKRGSAAHSFLLSRFGLRKLTIKPSAYDLAYQVFGWRRGCSCMMAGRIDEHRLMLADQQYLLSEILAALEQAFARDACYCVQREQQYIGWTREVA